MAGAIMERMKKYRLALLLAALVPFTAFSVVVIAEHGYLGFITLALREPWGMQILVDLALSMSLFAVWMVPDARARGKNPWPWLAACVGLGSIGALAYLVARELGARSEAKRSSLPRTTERRPSLARAR